MSKRHTITYEDLFVSKEFSPTGVGIEFYYKLAKGCENGEDKLLLIVARFSGFHDGKIIGVSMNFRVVSHGRVIAETDDIQAAIDAYNKAR